MPHIDHRAHTKILIARSPVHGFGVFAACRIDADEIIDECPCLPLEQGYEGLPSVINHYLYAWPREGDGRAAVWGSASIFNHSSSPSATWETMDDPPRCVFRATREIAAGEEIFIDYGSDYWERHDAYPPIDGAPGRALRDGSSV